MEKLAKQAAANLGNFEIETASTIFISRNKKLEKKKEE